MDQVGHARIMGSLPEDLIAGWTDGKGVVVLLGQGFQPVHNLRLADRMKHPVTAQAALKGEDAGRKVKAMDYFPELHLGFEGARAVAVLHCLSHEKTPVARQKDTHLPGRNLSQLDILVVGLVEAVETEHPQVDR